MAETTHNFPLPKQETQKLEEIEDELQQQPFNKKLADFVRANPWRSIAIAFSLGLVIGFTRKFTI